MTRSSLAATASSEDELFNDALEPLRGQTPLPTPGMGLIGAMVRDDAELLDQVTPGRHHPGPRGLGR